MFARNADRLLLCMIIRISFLPALIVMVQYFTAMRFKTNLNMRPVTHFCLTIIIKNAGEFLSWISSIRLSCPL
jgi:predicted ABC-type sugar transport system permease subunit